MLFRLSFCSIGAREMLRSSSPEAGESVEKSMKVSSLMKFLTFLSTLAAWRRLWDKAIKKEPKKHAPDQKTPELSLHFGDFLAAFWRHLFNVFLGTLPEGLFAVMGAILCHFGAQNGGKSVPKSVFWEKCRHAFGSSRLDRIACRASQIAPIIQKKRVINPTRF